MGLSFSCDTCIEWTVDQEWFCALTGAERRQIRNDDLLPPGPQNETSTHRCCGCLLPGRSRHAWFQLCRCLAILSCVHIQATTVDGNHLVNIYASLAYRADSAVPLHLHPPAGDA